MPRVLALALFLAACSSHPPHGVDPGTGSGTAVAVTPDAAPAVAAARVDAGPAPLTKDECDQVIDHILRVQFAAMNATRPKNKQLTDEDIPVAKAKLSAEMMDECLAWDRPSYDCIVAAPDIEAVKTCVGGA